MSGASGFRTSRRLKTYDTRKYANHLSPDTLTRLLALKAAPNGLGALVPRHPLPHAVEG
jgi:hypothetical protein